MNDLLEHHIREIRPLAVAVAMVSCLSMPGQAIGQGSVLEEITITAQKREQGLQDVGIAVTAYTEDQLRALGMTESGDVANLTPGVHLGGALAGQNQSFTIRGVTQNDFNDIAEAPNAVYIDEGYIANSNAQTFGLLDIARVEILKGPQGTLFGRNATGGLVHYISNKPNFDEVDGYIDYEYGHFDGSSGAEGADSQQLELAIGGPFSDNVAGRIAYMANKRDPYLTNLYPQGAVGNSPGPGAGADLADDDTYAIRGSLAFRPSEAVEINLSLSYSETEVSTGPYQSVATTPVFNSLGEHVNTVFTPGGVDPLGYKDPDGADFQTSSDFAFKDQGSTESTAFNGNVVWELSENVSFHSVTFYQEYDKLLFIDVDSGPANIAGNYAFADADSFTQEFRFSGDKENARWTAGLYYLNIDSESANGLKFPTGATAFDLGVGATLETNSYSIFGHYELDLSNDLTLITGLRVIQEEKEFDALEAVYASFSNNTFHQGAPLVLPRGVPLEGKSDDMLWTGKVQLDWKPTDDLLIYAGLSRGVKAGGFNAALPDAIAGPLAEEFVPYGEEVLLAYEAGFKSEGWLGGTTRINGSLYYYDYQDYQAFLFVSVGGYVINADAETYGAELEIISNPMDGLDLLLSAAVFDSEVQNIPIQAGSSTIINVEPTNAPPLQLTALARYEWGAFGGAMSVQGDISYTDKTYYNLRNFDSHQFDDYTLANASLSWRSASENWEISLIARNLTDERAGIQGFDVSLICGCSEVSYQAPRWYGMSARYSL